MKSQEIGNTSWYEEVRDVYVKTWVQLSEISDLCNVSSEHSTFLYPRGPILHCWFFFFSNHTTCTVLRPLCAKGRDAACSINLRRSDFGKEQNIHAQRKRMGSAAMPFAIFQEAFSLPISSLNAQPLDTFSNRQHMGSQWRKET